MTKRLGKLGLAAALVTARRSQLSRRRRWLAIEGGLASNEPARNEAAHRQPVSDYSVLG
ncbi:hypothetical protein MESS4_330020 [Mesorhizobium sp. STM 4661]|nr:hypothetical protein MESS4_330020 [Mesorhizobium sp. STM 4661]